MCVLQSITHYIINQHLSENVALYVIISDRLYGPLTVNRKSLRFQIENRISQFSAHVSMRNHKFQNAYLNRKLMRLKPKTPDCSVDFLPSKQCKQVEHPQDLIIKIAAVLWVCNSESQRFRIFVHQWVLGGYNPNRYSRILMDFAGFIRILTDLAGFGRICHGFGDSRILGNGRNTVSRVLFRRRELTEPH